MCELCNGGSEQEQGKKSRPPRGRVTLTLTDFEQCIVFAQKTLSPTAHLQPLYRIYSNEGTLRLLLSYMIIDFRTK